MKIIFTYKIHNFPNFEENHQDYFNDLLEIINKHNLLSSNIDEIIITDDIDQEIINYCKNRPFQPNLTRSREYKAIGKTVNFDGVKKIFLDAHFVNGYAEWTPQIFFEQLIEVYAEDIIGTNYSVSSKFYSGTPLSEVLAILLFQWSTKTLSHVLKRTIKYERETIHPEVKIYVDSFKRNIRKLHYQHQDDLDLQTFWIKVIYELDNFIRRCIDVNFDNGSFDNLQEFEHEIPELLKEILIQTENIIGNTASNIDVIKVYILNILRECFIDIPSENPMCVKITDSPKKLFKGSLVDTEPRIVAFIDILGFSAIIKEYDSDKTSNLLNELHETLEQAVKISIDNILDQKIKNDLQDFLEYRMFSDCICISLPYIEFGNDFHLQFHSLSFVVKSYQLAMMQKGFFVRGGIAMGSYFSDRNMIFSGGLVNAYKLEMKVNYPIIGIDKKVLERLNKNFRENSKELCYDNLLVFSEKFPNTVFLNPFDILDNSAKYFDYLEESLDHITQLDSNDVLSQYTDSILQLTKSFTQPIFELAKSQITKEKIDDSKNKMLQLINAQIKKHELILENNPSSVRTIEEMKKIIEKYSFLRSLIQWTLGENDAFKIHIFSQSQN